MTDVNQYTAKPKEERKKTKRILIAEPELDIQQMFRSYTF
jgi:hypothetical protein